MNGANLIGYIRCKWGSGQKISSAAKSFFTAQFIKSVSIPYGLVKIRCPYDLALRGKNKVFRKLLKYLEFCSST